MSARPASADPSTATPRMASVRESSPESGSGAIPTRVAYVDPEAEVLPWTGLSLLVALAGLFLLIAFPGSDRAAAAEQALDGPEELELVTALADFRRAVVAYRAEQGHWPGAGLPSSPRPPAATGDASWEAWFERHVVAEVVHAQAGAEEGVALAGLAAYLPDGVLPLNVANGLRTVRVLAPGERMPARPDGRSGWILDPRNGELRANSAGRLSATGRGLFDL